jgi:hypothetical protein
LKSEYVCSFDSAAPVEDARQKRNKAANVIEKPLSVILHNSFQYCE